MEVQAIKEIMSAFSEAGMTKLSLKCESFELKLEKEVAAPITQVVEMPYQAAMQMAPTVITQAPSAQEVTMAPNVLVEPALQTKNITSPMVGTFYAASSPDAEPFVKIGTKVKKGDIVCVIEAMKLMNEVEAEEEGEIVEVLIGNEEMVEYGQPLFRLK